MHRSGTSAVAGIATLLGAEPPGGMVPAASDNPNGFWESAAIVITNQGLHTGLGYNWYDCLPFDSTLLGPDLRLSMVPQLETTLQDDFGSARMFVIKDPRMCLVLDVWKPVLAGAAALLCLRHPAEVAGSLFRRDRCNTEIGLTLWLHYTLEAERSSRDLPRAIVSYDRFLQDWRGTMIRVGRQAGIPWLLDPASAVEDDSRRVAAKYRHHFAAPDRVTVSKPPIRGWIADTWRVMRASEASGLDASATQTLDQIRTDFAEWRRSAPRVLAVPRTD